MNDFKISKPIKAYAIVVIAAVIVFTLAILSEVDGSMIIIPLIVAANIIPLMLFLFSMKISVNDSHLLQSTMFSKKSIPFSEIQSMSIFFNYLFTFNIFRFAKFSLKVKTSKKTHKIIFIYGYENSEALLKSLEEKTGKQVVREKKTFLNS